MKKFKIKIICLSKKADFKIRIQLFILQFKKSISNIGYIKILIPTFMFAIFAVGIFNTIWNTKINSDVIMSNNQVEKASYENTINKLKRIRNNKYYVKSKKRKNIQKVEKYTQYAYIRTANLREHR